MEMQIGFLESTQKIKHNHPQAWGRSNSQLTTPGEALETRKTLTPDKTTISLRISKVRLETKDLARRLPDLPEHSCRGENFAARAPTDAIPACALTKAVRGRGLRTTSHQSKEGHSPRCPHIIRRLHNSRFRRPKETRVETPIGFLKNSQKPYP